MPERVVTFDVAALLGVPVIACVAVPYRDQGVPAPLQGGKYLDLVAILPPGTANAASLHPFMYEALSGMPARLKTETDGAQHEVWGWRKRQSLLSPGNPDEAEQIASTRSAALSFDFGAHMNARVLEARTLPVLGTKRAYELLLDDTTDPQNFPSEQVYDTLDAHPAELREIVETSPWLRRETASDPAPAWTDRKPVP